MNKIEFGKVAQLNLSRKKAAELRHARAKELFDEGKDRGEIAAVLGVSRDTVTRYLSTYGVTFQVVAKERKKKIDQAHLINAWKRTTGTIGGLNEALAEARPLSRRCLDSIWNTPACPRNAPRGFTPRQSSVSVGIEFSDLLSRWRTYCGVAA